MSIQWSLVLFTALTGLAGWMYACIATDEFLCKTKQTAFKAALVALVVAIVGGVASVTHLAHPENMLNVLGHPTAGIFVEALLTGLMCLCGIVYLVLVKREAGAGARKAFAVLAAAIGIILSFAVGYSYMMASIPAWNTILLPFAYMGSAIPAGVAAYLMVAALQKEEADALKPYGMFLLVGGLIAALTILVYMCLAGLGQIGLGIVAVILGGLVPAACGLMITRKPEKASTYAVVALICAFAGVLCVRCAMWLVFDKAINLFGLTI